MVFPVESQHHGIDFRSITDFVGNRRNYRRLNEFIIETAGSGSCQDLEQEKRAYLHACWVKGLVYRNACHHRFFDQPVADYTD